jgi:aryl-alcohol dehydrogenase-like predicted oxidoreductase
MSAGPLCPVTYITTSFPPEHVSKYADLVRNQLGTDYIDLLQFHVWTEEWTDEPGSNNAEALMQ